MAFSGSLQFYSPFDLLESIAKQEKTGLLRLQQDDINTAIFFQEGNILSASKTDVHLPRLLMVTSSTPAGLSIPKLQQKLQVQVQDIVTDILDWNKGQYIFETDYQEEPEFHLFESLPTMSLIYNSLRLLDEWEHIKRTITSFGLIFRRTGKAPDDDLDRKEQKILSLIDGKRNVQVLIDGVNISKYDLLSALCKLVEEEYAEIAQEPVKSVRFRKTSSHRLDRRQVFRNKLEDSRPSQQRKAMQMSPDKIEEIFESLSATSADQVFSPPNQIIVSELIEECVKQGLDFTLVRTVQLTLTAFRKASSFARAKAVPFIEKMATSLINLDKQEHLNELVNSYSNALVTEKERICFDSMALGFSNIEASLRKTTWGDDLRCRIVHALGHGLNPKSSLSGVQRLHLVEILGAIPSKEKVVPLVNGIAHGDLELTEKAKQGIFLHRELVSAPLVELMKNSDTKEQRLIAVELLKEVGEDAFPYLRELRNDSRWYVRRNGALLLGHINRPQAAEVLAELVNDEEPKVRDAAVDGIAKQNQANAERLLLRSLETNDDALRCRILRHLGKVGKDYTANYLSTLIMKRAFDMGDGDNEVLAELCNTLGAIGSPLALEALHKIITHRRLLRSSKLGLVISAACNAAGKIGHPDSLPVLKSHNDTANKSIRASAEKAYKRIKHAKATR